MDIALQQPLKALLLANHDVDKLVRNGDLLDDRLAFKLLCKAFVGLDGGNGVFFG